jgi:ABC-type Fe3+-siderophore transport system permease subunit
VGRGPRPLGLGAAAAGLTTPFLAGGLLVLAAIAIFIGPYPISLADALRAVWDRLSGNIPETGTTLDTILFFVRLPRVVAAMLVGGALAAAAVGYQGLFRNPLVSPTFSACREAPGSAPCSGSSYRCRWSGSRSWPSSWGSARSVSCC